MARKKKVVEPNEIIQSPPTVDDSLIASKAAENLINEVNSSVEENSHESIITVIDENGNEKTIDLELCENVANEVVHSLFGLDETIKNFSIPHTFDVLFKNCAEVLLNCGLDKYDLIRAIVEDIEVVDDFDLESEEDLEE